MIEKFIKILLVNIYKVKEYQFLTNNSFMSLQYRHHRYTKNKLIGYYITFTNEKDRKNKLLTLLRHLLFKGISYYSFDNVQCLKNNIKGVNNN